MNEIGSSTVPSAISLPVSSADVEPMYNPVPLLKITRTPGSIVNVAPPLTVTFAVTRYTPHSDGEVSPHVVDDVIEPATLNGVQAGVGDGLGSRVGVTAGVADGTDVGVEVGTGLVGVAVAVGGGLTDGSVVGVGVSVTVGVAVTVGAEVGVAGAAPTQLR